MSDTIDRYSMPQEELLAITDQAAREGWTELDLSNRGIAELPPEIGQLASLTQLFLQYNQLSSLPESIAQLASLTQLYLTNNQLSALPKSIGQLVYLTRLDLYNNQLSALPESIAQLARLTQLYLYNNQLSALPESIGQLARLTRLDLGNNQLTTLPESIAQLAILRELYLENNQLSSLPLSLADLENLRRIDLEDNPLDPALQSAAEQGIDALKAYLRSLEGAEPLYEAKLVLVGEGDVGKTTLLKALSGREPRKDEKTTHGISIDIHAMHIPHPHKPGVDIQLNAWDFGGQEVYRVTHQFFFSQRSIYLVVWEPRMGVQQCQVEDWLQLIRLRVGDDARVIVVSTHAKTGQRIARIDKQVFQRDYGSMIVDFLEVDSLERDPTTGQPYGIAELRSKIAEVARGLAQMGMPFNPRWKAARDELIALGQSQPCDSYGKLLEVCARHGLDQIESSVLAHLMHDLGYIVYYGDDERLKDSVVLQPEWLTKAIGFVLEDRATQEREGLLPDSHLENVWLRHPFAGEPTYEPALYPFFLRLMEKYDVCYRLEDGTASLVAQHVPQVQPSLPWLPEEDVRDGQRRLAMVCVMEEAPPGLVPWMIVRTHDYAREKEGHRLHWQKGMFLANKGHGEALLELRGREFHLYAEAVWPEYFMSTLRQTLCTLIDDNWPGLEGRYKFTVPCANTIDGEPCKGRFEIDALRQFLAEGDQTYRCQDCRARQDLVELLYGFDDDEPREQLARIESQLQVGFSTLRQDLAGLESRILNSVMSIMRAMANEAREGPRLFNVEPVDGNWRRLVNARYRLRLWCEAEGCQHPVVEPNRGSYEFKSSRQWVHSIAPYAKLIAGLLKTLLPMVTPSVDTLFGAKTIEGLGIDTHLDLMKELAGALPGEIRIEDPGQLRDGLLSHDERSGLLTLHALLRELDPHQARLGLYRVPTYTGDYLWLCQQHYELSQSKIPDTIGESKQAASPLLSQRERNLGGEGQYSHPHTERMGRDEKNAACAGLSAAGRMRRRGAAGGNSDRRPRHQHHRHQRPRHRHARGSTHRRGSIPDGAAGHGRGHQPRRRGTRVCRAAGAGQV